MEIITEAGPGSGEGGFCPFTEWAACFSKPVNYISQHPLLSLLISVTMLCHQRSSGALSLLSDHAAIHSDCSPLPQTNCDSTQLSSTFLIDSPYQMEIHHDLQLWGNKTVPGSTVANKNNHKSEKKMFEIKKEKNRLENSLSRSIFSLSLSLVLQLSTNVGWDESDCNCAAYNKQWLQSR